MRRLGYGAGGERGEVGEGFDGKGCGRRGGCDPLLREYETVEGVGILRPNEKIHEIFCFFRAVPHVSLTFLSL